MMNLLVGLIIAAIVLIVFIFTLLVEPRFGTKIAFVSSIILAETLVTILYLSSLGNGL